MVNHTKTNVKLSDNFNQTYDTFQILDYVDYLERSPNKNGKFLCPHCGKNDFDYNRKTGKGFQCFSGSCKPNEIVKALKVKAGDWVEKNSNYSFTSDYTTNKHSKQAVTVDNTTVKVLKKVKEARPKDYQEYHLQHDVLDSDGQVVWVAKYENHAKLKGHQYFRHPDGTQSNSNITDIAGGTEKILPFTFFHGGFKHLIKVNLTKLLITEGELTAVACDRKLEKYLSAIAPYNGSNENLIPALVGHLKLIPNLKEIVLSPDFDKKGFKYMMALSKELKKAGYSVQWLFPYPDSYWDRLNNLPDGHEAVDMTDYLFKSNLTAEQIINQIKVISDDELEQMLTGKTVTVSNVASYAVPMNHYLSSENTGVKWLVPGLIQEGASNMIVAYSNVGKSTLCSQLAIALTQGDNFLGHELAGDKKVLYHTSDESISDLAERVKSQGYIDTNDNFKVFNEIDGVIWDVTNLESLDYELTHNDHDVVFMDSLSSICASAGINENGPEIGQKLTELIKIVCNKHGKTLVIVHHANRGVLNTNRLNIGNVCGHNSIARPLNQIIALKENTTEDGENVIDLLTVKARSSGKTELTLVRDDEGKFQVIESINTPTINTTETNNSNEKLIIDCLSQSDDWLTRDAIQGHTKLTLSTCNRLLLDLTNTGKIERAKIGKGYQYRINNLLTCSPAQDIYKSNEQENEQEAVTIDNTTSESLLLTCSNDSEQENEQVVEQVKDNLKKSKDVINVQLTLMDNYPTSDKKDIVDTEKESQQDTKVINGKTFRTGDIYWQFKNKDTLIQIDSFPDGCDYAKCYKVDIDSTGKVTNRSEKPEYVLWLDKETYPYDRR